MQRGHRGREVAHLVAQGAHVVGQVVDRQLGRGHAGLEPGRLLLVEVGAVQDAVERLGHPVDRLEHRPVERLLVEVTGRTAPSTACFTGLSRASSGRWAPAWAWGRASSSRARA
ncbi:MAG: hypothetical protein R2711_14090 [Acidimicrobiales bacterium]